MPSAAEKIKYPVFMSISCLKDRKSPLDHKDWMMDSGGFTMISQHGKYTISETEYIEHINRHNPLLAFCQDWMCEGFILKKTGLTIKEHQKRTLESYLSLSAKSDKMRPVLQGWYLEDYLRHLDMYANSKVDMSQLFGVGTVCSRNGNPRVILDLLSGIKRRVPEIQLHGFGVKTQALAMCAPLLYSADSMAWSFTGRMSKICDWCNKANCANCLEFALLWRRKILHQVELGPDKKESVERKMSVSQGPRMKPMM